MLYSLQYYCYKTILYYYEQRYEDRDAETTQQNKKKLQLLYYI